MTVAFDLTITTPKDAAQVKQSKIKLNLQTPF